MSLDPTGTDTSTRRPPWWLLLVGVAIVAIVASAGMALANERERAEAIATIGEQRATATSYVEHILLESVGEPADPDALAEELEAVAEAFLEGGTVDMLQGSSHNERPVDPEPAGPVRAKLVQQRELVTSLVDAGEALRAISPDDPAWSDQLQDVRTQAALLRSVSADTVGEMGLASRRTLQLQLELLLLLAAVVVVGGGMGMRAARKGGRVAEGSRYEALLHHAADWVAVIDEADHITYSTRAGQQFRPDGDGVLGASIVDLPVDGANRARLERALAECRANGTSATELDLTAAGSSRRVTIRLTDLRDVADVRGVVLNVHDRTEESALRQQLERMAYADGLTGLANRFLLAEHLTTAFGRVERGSSGPTLLFLDLDDFKLVNDAYGHAAGDELLLEVANRLSTVTRPMDVVARLGGDEFAVLLTDGVSPAEALELAQRIGEAIRRPVPLSSVGAQVTITASIGLRAHGPDDDPDQFMRDADVAMYAAKTNSKGTIRFFDQAMHDAAVRRHATAQDLRAAIGTEQLWLAVQPKVSAADGRVVGLEGLLRWDHPIRGSVSPAEFISIAEDTGLISELGRHVVREGGRIASQLARIPGLDDLKVSINVSSRELGAGDFVAGVLDAIADTGAQPSQLILEITETALATDPETAAERLAELVAAGFTLSIDDFGTGYSSLSRLRSYPISELKVDRSFVTAAATDERSRAILLTVAGLGRELALDVIAEGVEDPEHLEVVRAAGIPFVQGFLFARPMSLQAFLDSRPSTLAVG